MVRKTMVLEGLGCDPSESVGFGKACVCDKVRAVISGRKESKPYRGPGKIPVEECTGVDPRLAGRKTHPPFGYGKWAMVACGEKAESYARAMRMKERQALTKSDVWNTQKFPLCCRSFGYRQTCKVKMKDTLLQVGTRVGSCRSAN